MKHSKYKIFPPLLVFVVCGIFSLAINSASYSQDAAPKPKYAQQELWQDWEVVHPLPGQKITVGRTLWRTKVPSGWLVTFERNLVFVPDAEHHWKPQQKK